MHVYNRQWKLGTSRRPFTLLDPSDVTLSSVTSHDDLAEEGVPVGAVVRLPVSGEAVQPDTLPLTRIERLIVAPVFVRSRRQRA